MIGLLHPAPESANLVEMRVEGDDNGAGFHGLCSQPYIV